jgi:hypothetical protein
VEDPVLVISQVRLESAIVVEVFPHLFGAGMGVAAILSRIVRTGLNVAVSVSVEGDQVTSPPLQSIVHEAEGRVIRRGGAIEVPDSSDGRDREDEQGHDGYDTNSNFITVGLTLIGLNEISATGLG